MSLPSNFWDEFDRRLNAFEKKIDEKLDKRLSASEKKINDKIDKVIKWTQRQDESIERELTMACFNHFQNAYPGYVTVVPAKSMIGRIAKDSKGLTITDFDGLIILTNDNEYARFLRGYSNGKSTLADGHNAYVVIIEAKQHVTAKKIKNKIQQRDKLQHSLFTTSILAGVDKFIGLYIGGIDVDAAAKTEIDQFITDNKGKQFIGTLELNGLRFTVQDIKNEHGESSIMWHGGGKKKYTQI